ncbi:LIC_10190 family membrane protein [Puniceicoccus vermicola]|uniref:LIC_10190 family membrane protein n=1 Tax=Puniceicoccus vermicola TaxID=388746 RepID=UPI003483CD50
MTLVFYGILGLAFLGWAKAFLFAARISKKESDSIPLSFLVWAGWACVLFLLGVIHFFLPITVYAMVPILLVGICLSVLLLDWRKIAEAGQSVSEGKLYKVVLALLVFGLLLWSCWIASRGMMAPRQFDSGLYHLNSIRWLNEYPLIPGLGNLHGRLAFNSSFFTFVAALNMYPIFGYGRSVANGFLLILSVVTFLELLLPLLRRPSQVFHLSPILWAIPLFCLPVLAFWSLSSSGISSPSPDLTSNLLQLVLFVLFARLAVRFFTTREVVSSEALIFSLLGATALTVKLSSVAFCGIMMGLLWVGILCSRGKRLRLAGWFLFAAFLVLVLQAGRGVVLSGAPLYPSTLGYLELDWSVPLESIENEHHWVSSWARQPGSHFKEVLGSWYWFGPWLDRMSSEFTEVVFPLILFLIVGSASVVFWKMSRINGKEHCLRVGVLLLPLIAALVFWFFTAPDLRFANAFFFLLPILAIAGILSGIQSTGRRNVMVMMTLFFFIFGNSNLIYWVYQNRDSVRIISREGWRPTEKVTLEAKLTKSGLSVFVPVSGQLTWDAPLPSTPFLNENLRLRKSDSLASGFTVQPPDIVVDSKSRLH